MKNNNGEKGDGDARYDKVDGMKECLAADCHIKGDVRLRFRATVVSLHVFTRRYTENVPLNTLVKLFQINTMLYDVPDPRPALLLVNVGQVDLQTPQYTQLLTTNQSINQSINQSQCLSSRATSRLNNISAYTLCLKKGPVDYR